MRVLNIDKLFQTYHYYYAAYRIAQICRISLQLILNGSGKCENIFRVFFFPPKIFFSFFFAKKKMIEFAYNDSFMSKALISSLIDNFSKIKICKHPNYYLFFFIDIRKK